ncbi:MAG: hypothetical protein ACRDHZ_11430, partial [Ktedonobacteraceae bacterium]
MSFETTTYKPASAEYENFNNNLVAPEIGGPVKSDASQARSWLEHPVTLTAGAALGGGLGHELIPRGLDLLSKHEFAEGGRWHNVRGTLGTEMLGKDSAIARTFPRVNLVQGEHAINEVSRAGLNPLAKAWQANKFVPEARQGVAAAAESTTAAAAESRGALQGLRTAASQMTESASKY